MATMKIGNYAMLDALRMIPQSWTYSADIYVQSNGCVVVNYDGYNFTLEGDGIVYVEKDGEKKSYDDHAQYPCKPGQKFLEICMERYEHDCKYEATVELVTKMRSEALEKIDQLYAMGVMTADMKHTAVMNVRSFEWFSTQFEKISGEEV